VSPAQIKNNLWIFVNCLIENPAFDSQSKEHLVTPEREWGSKCDLTPKFIQEGSGRSLADMLMIA
jgi:DNA topoisomerase-2